MPAVRMISVWPIASTPTTITCCRISEKFWPVRKRSLCEAKKTHASSSAMNGPSVDTGGRCSSTPCHPVPLVATVEWTLPTTSSPKGPGAWPGLWSER